MLADLLTTVGASPQPVECTNCSNATGTVGIVLAAVAIVVSLRSLYITALRRPAIYVEHVPRDNELRFNAWSEGLPRQAEISLWIVIGNTGASATFVDKLELARDIRYHGARQAPFGPMEIAPPSLHVKGTGHGMLPAVFERGDGESYRLSAAFARAPGVTGPEALAKIVQDLEAVTFTIEWTYRRSKLLRPNVRETVHKHLTVRVPTDDLRRTAVMYWRGHADYHHLADIAEGKAEPAVTRP